jgi:hypothetical protein
MCASRSCAESSCPISIPSKNAETICGANSRSASRRRSALHHPRSPNRVLSWHTISSAWKSSVVFSPRLILRPGLPRASRRRGCRKITLQPGRPERVLAAVCESSIANLRCSALYRQNKPEQKQSQVLSVQRRTTNLYDLLWCCDTFSVAINEDDDVQNVYANFEVSDALMGKMSA